MEINYGLDLDKAGLEELLQLDTMVYEADQLGDTQSVWERYEKNKNSFTITTVNGLPIGYVCTFPITDALYDIIKAKEMLVDSHILPEQIKDYEQGNTYNLYIISFVIHPDYQGSSALKYILLGFANRLHALQEQGIKFNKILAHAISPKGYKLLDSLGFQIVAKTHENTSIMETFVQTVIDSIQNRLKNRM